jgi:hypothetical protein
MTEETLAVIEGKAQKIKKAMEEASLTGSGDSYHDDVYLNIRDDVVNTVVGSPGNIVLSYCTFTSQFDNVEVEAEDTESVEAIVEVDKFLTYFGFTTDAGDVRISFRGNPDDRLATAVEITGSLNARLMLPDSESILEEVPMNLPNSFTDEERYAPDEGGEAPVKIRVDTGAVERVIEVVEYDPEIDYYPIAVEDGELTLNVSQEDAPGRDSVWGSLNAHSVETPEDFTNHYHEGFVDAFGSLSGEVEIQTAPTGAPAIIVKVADGRVLRHMLGPVGN